MGCIYGQRVQKGRSLVRVQAISSLSGGWGEILGGCTLVRIESWSFVHQAFIRNHSILKFHSFEGAEILHFVTSRSILS